MTPYISVPNEPNYWCFEASLKKMYSSKFMQSSFVIKIMLKFEPAS